MGVAHARRGQAIERRRETLAIAVRTEPIAAQRVDGHQQHVAAAQLTGLQWRHRVA